MRMIESLFDMVRLSDDAPDEGYDSLRGGIPVETPQERELSGGGQGGGQGVATGWPEGGQGVAAGRHKAPAATPWYSKSVPTTEISPMWWAKATREVCWRWDRAVRQIVWWICVAVTVLLAGCGVFPQWLVLTMVNTLLFLVIDPFMVLGRRVAIQSRLLLATSAGSLFVAICSPSIPAFAVFGVITVFAGVAVAMCNTEWVVTANYISSPTIHAAMANDPTSSAHRSWEGFGSKLAYTYSSEMGYPPTSNFIWAILRGVYVIGWTLGVKRVITEDEVAEMESNEERAQNLEAQVRELRYENEMLSQKIDELEDPELVEGLRAQVRNLKEELGKSDRAQSYFRGETKKAQEEKEADLLKMAEEHAKEIDDLNTSHAKELEALRLEQAAELAALKEQCRQDVEAAETAMLGDSGGLREKLLLAMLQNGVSSQKQLSEMTGIPRTTVRRILDKWRVDSGHGEDAA